MTNTTEVQNRIEKSETIGKLALALVQFQSTVNAIPKDSQNPFFKSSYASLSSILKNIQTPLSGAGLAFSQLPIGSNGLTTILIHAESGEYIQSTYYMTPVKNDPQGIGSAITYMRRYALGAVLGLNIDEDDDGNSASKPRAEPKRQQQAKSQLSERGFKKALERIENGETELVGKLIETYKLSTDQLAEIHNLQILDQKTKA